MSRHVDGDEWCYEWCYECGIPVSAGHQCNNIEDYLEEKARFLNDTLGYAFAPCACNGDDPTCKTCEYALYQRQHYLEENHRDLEAILTYFEKMRRQIEKLHQTVGKAYETAYDKGVADERSNPQKPDLDKWCLWCKEPIDPSGGRASYTHFDNWAQPTMHPDCHAWVNALIRVRIIANMNPPLGAGRWHGAMKKEAMEILEACMRRANARIPWKDE